MMDAAPRLPPIHPFLQWLAKLLFRIAGWRVEGELPAGGRAVVIAAPHTSYWDGPIMVAAGCVFGIRFSWMVKEAAFFFPLGIVVRAFGGIAIDRSRRSNVVAQSVEQFQRNDALLLAVSPEGTRGHGDHWKTGFYRIAEGAGVPVALGFIDYARKVAGIGPCLDVTGDIKADFTRYEAFYAKITPRHPERRGVVAVPPEKIARPEDDADLRNAG